MVLTHFAMAAIAIPLMIFAFVPPTFVSFFRRKLGLEAKNLKLNEIFDMKKNN